MADYIKRFLIVVLMAFFISLLFLGGTSNAASDLDKDVWLWPADGVISDPFGARGGQHVGVDIAGAWNSNVYAAYEGRVIRSYYSATYGNAIFIEHPNGYVTVYAHMDKRLKEVGESVKSGELIGKMGSTGLSTGVHLHFEVHSSAWNYAKSNVLNPEVIYGPLRIGQEKTTQSRLTYVQSILQKRKEEKLAKEGLWKNLNQSESAKDWLKTRPKSFAAERVQSVRNIPINTGVMFAETEEPISSAIDFSGMFLLAGLHKRRKGISVSLAPAVSYVQRKPASDVISNPTSKGVFIPCFPMGLANFPIMKQKILFLLAQYKARSRIWQPWFGGIKRYYLLFQVKQWQMTLLAFKKWFVPLLLRKETAILLSLL